jgi:hypothetical protein
MHGDEDYMDEDGPEFIGMINDLVRNVRTEITTHPHDAPSGKCSILIADWPFESRRLLYCCK